MTQMAESAESAEILWLERVRGTSARLAAALGQNQARNATNEVAMAGEPCKRIIDTNQDASAPRASLRGARCGNFARRDLRGGLRVTGIPTSIAKL